LIFVNNSGAKLAGMFAYPNHMAIILIG